jgi:RNA methyltransferase, TrmH family
MSFLKFKAMLEANDFHKYNYVKIDTFHLLEEAIKNNMEINILCVYPSDFSNISFANVYEVSELFIKKFTDLKTHHGFIALVYLNDINIKSSGNSVLLDEIQDPGNAGSIIRTALGLNINNIYLTEGCASIKNSKFVRATEGAIFNVKLHYIKRNEIQDMKNYFQIVSTSLSNKSKDLIEIKEADFDNSKKMLIAFGNEARGIHKDILDISDLDIKISINPLVESYSVVSASAIVLFYLKSFFIKEK